MTAAALTPRVRIFVVCDEVIPSDIEEAVYTLEGVRQHSTASNFPCLRSLNAFLVLSCPRKGTYAGTVKIVDLGEMFTIREEKLQVRRRGGRKRAWRAGASGPSERSQRALVARLRV